MDQQICGAYTCPKLDTEKKKITERFSSCTQGENSIRHRALSSDSHRELTSHPGLEEDELGRFVAEGADVLHEAVVADDMPAVHAPDDLALAAHGSALRPRRYCGCWKHTSDSGRVQTHTFMIMSPCISMTIFCSLKTCASAK
jgi:hypothetical protein